MENIEHLEGIILLGQNINNLRFADDVSIMAYSQHNLKKLVDKLAKKGESQGLKTNTKKTCYFLISKQKEAPN